MKSGIIEARRLFPVAPCREGLLQGEADIEEQKHKRLSCPHNSQALYVFQNF
jgi:hypothetical protein